jgi:kynurenine formamidase
MKLPAFDDLPVLEGLGLRHAWDAFGPGDQLGTVNLLTPDRVKAASGLVHEGSVFNLVLPLNEIDPPLYGREPLKHTVFAINRNTLDDRLDNFFLQSSSQWDGLRHMKAREFGFWGGHKNDDELQPGSGPLGIEHWVEHGLVGRGVLLDVARRLEEEGDYDPFVERHVTAEELDATARDQGVEIREGDILCIRFGWMGKYRALDAEGKRHMATAHSFVGLRPDEDMARWIWNHHVAALACDNPAIEASPGDPNIGSLHRRVLPLLGLALGELFDFDRLAVACAADKRWEFLFVAVPLYVPGGVGSPANAIAVR